MINRVSQNRPSLQHLGWELSSTNVGYLGSAAVISLAAFRSDAQAVKYGTKVFSAILRAGCKENRAALRSLLLVSAWCKHRLTLPLHSDLRGFGAGATVLGVTQGLSWLREGLDHSLLPPCRGERCPAAASAPAHAAAQCCSPHLLIRAEAALLPEAVFPSPG